MDLWIRSQDRESITKISNIQYSFSNKLHVLGTYYDNLKVLGIYESKNRALEVLDEIQQYMMLDKNNYEGEEKVSYQDCACYKNDNLMIYEMPKE